MAVTMTNTEYENLLAAAKAGDTSAIKVLQDDIDAANGILRFAVLIRWTEVGGKAVALPSPYSWPETQTGQLDKMSTISKADVEEYVASRSTNAVNIQLTKDLEGVAGWTELDDYDFQANAS